MCKRVTQSNIVSGYDFTSFISRLQHTGNPCLQPVGIKSAWPPADLYWPLIHCLALLCRKAVEKSQCMTDKYTVSYSTISYLVL